MPRDTKRRDTKRSSSGRARQSAGQVRIIAGRWRGRKLPVADAQGLRPTGDRVRETLFNWLQTDVAGAHCLDLFAGTGALGLEAGSRDAASVVLVEHNASVAQTLRDTLAMLGGDARIQVQHSSAEAFLQSNDKTFDLVFVDPPFAAASQQWALQILDSGQHLNPKAMVYVEQPASSEGGFQAPEPYTVVKHRQFGEVSAYVLQYE